MRIDEIKPAANSKKTSKRLGRGIGSGLGKTSGKGNKGQNARSGGGVRLGFEGGQVPLMRRIPKRGFDNNFKKVYSIVNISELEIFDNGATVDALALLEQGILSKIEPYGVKVLGNGVLTKKITVKANKFSAQAEEKIKNVGGNTEVL